MLLKQVMNRFVETPLSKAEAPSDAKVQDGDKVIGVLSDDLKRLYRVLTDCSSNRIAIREKHKKRVAGCKNPDLEISEEEKKRILHDLGMSQNEVDLVRNCFWKSVYNDFPEALEYPSVCISDKWEVFLQHPKNAFRESLEDLVSAMFK